jgi:CRISPR-associated protein Cas2
MEYLTVYDIADPRRLQRVARRMAGFGIRVQKSVFECDLSESALQAMRTSVEEVMDIREDSVRIYPLLANARAKQQILGTGEVVEFPPAYIL